jgi:hypothetical protein
LPHPSHSEQSHAEQRSRLHAVQGVTCSATHPPSSSYSTATRSKSALQLGQVALVERDLI